MDVRELQTVGTGRITQVIVIKSLGNQDEDVDIMNDGDPDGTPLAAAGASGVGTPPKSVAGSTTAPRVGVDSLAYRLREQQTASFGRQTVPQLLAGEHGSSKYSDVSVPKVSLEGTSMQSDYPQEMSAKSSGGRVRLLELMQLQSKRKASETEPSTMAPPKRSGDSRDMTGHKNRTDERDVAPTMREDSSLMRKEGEGMKRKEGEGRQKTPPVMVRGKRPRVLRLDDLDSDEEFNDGFQNPETRMPIRAGDNGTGPLRSAFPVNAKTEVPPQRGAALATQNAEKHILWQWVTCTKCKKIRLVNADEELDISSWYCEKNIQSPMYSSCSAPQEKGKVEERQVFKIESAALEEVQEAPKYPNELERKRRAQQKMVWVKVHVDGKQVWWPGLTVKVVPAAVQKIMDEAGDDPGRAVRLFHPPKHLGQYHVVRKSSLKPFFLRAFRNSSSHPDFQVAVTEADQYFAEPDMKEFSESLTGSKSETRLNAAGDVGKCLLNYDDKEASKASEGGGTKEFCAEKMVLDLEILPRKNLIDITKELLVQDGNAVSMDPVSLGKEFNRCSTGPSLQECIYEVGKANIRKRSSSGLKLDSLDQHGDFAKRLRSTWLWEYDGEQRMPVYLTSRFVAGCILEAQGKAVNWAHELSSSVRNELKQIGMKKLESFSPRALKLIDRLLEKKVDPTPTL